MGKRETSKPLKLRGNEPLKSVCYRHEDDEYTVEILHVEEIIRLAEMTHQPAVTDNGYLSVSLRGGLITAVDLRTRLGLTKPSYAEQNRLVVIANDGELTGLIVDDIREIMRAPDSDLEVTAACLAVVENRSLDGGCQLSTGRRLLVLIQRDAEENEGIEQVA